MYNYLQGLYQRLHSNTLQQLNASNFEPDPYLQESVQDTRRGLTLLTRPTVAVKMKVVQVLDDLQRIAPDQYYYPSSDLHITILSIISCYPGFQLKQISLPDYLNVIKECLTGLPPFSIKLSGLTFSPGAIMIRGYYEEGTLDKVRDRLRIAFQQSSLQQSIDSRYRLETAHITIARFRIPPSNKIALLQLLERYHEYSFGTFNINTLELVANDWYQRQQHTQHLASFSLQ